MRYLLFWDVTQDRLIVRYLLILGDEADRLSQNAGG
jgi:hypothetical protein